MKRGEVTTTDERLTELEMRVAALEVASASAVSDQPSRTGEQTDDADASGEVRYSGTVHLHGDVEWNIRYSAARILELADAPAAAALAALGQPSRIAIIRRLLTGPATGKELVEAAGLSSTGQLYHHLHSLTAARFVEQDSRGSYRMPHTVVVPTLVLLLAATDVAGPLAEVARRG